MMHNHIRQGFSLVMVIFLLVILSTALSFLLKISRLTQTGSQVDWHYQQVVNAAQIRANAILYHWQGLNQTTIEKATQVCQSSVSVASACQTNRSLLLASDSSALPGITWGDSCQVSSHQPVLEAPSILQVTFYVWAKKTVPQGVLKECIALKTVVNLATGTVESIEEPQL